MNPKSENNRSGLLKTKTLCLLAVLMANIITMPAFAQKSKSGPGNIRNEHALRNYLDQKNTLYEKLIITLGEEYWKYYANEASFELTKPKNDLALFFRDPEFNQLIMHWFGKLPAIKDTILSKEIFMWHNLLVASEITMDEGVRSLQTQIEDSVTQRMSSGDRSGWEAIDALTIRLLKLRNELSRKIGYRNFGDAALELSFMDTVAFFRYVRIIDSMTYEPYRKLVEEYKIQNNKQEFTLRDYYRLYMKYLQAAEITRVPSDSNRYFTIQTLAGIGIDYSKLPITTYIDKPLPPPAGGQGIAVRIPDDFRIVVIPDLPFSYRMHEVGHGLQAMFTSIKSPVLKGYEWLLGGLSPTFGEGMADVLREFVNNPEWLVHFRKVNPDSLKKWSETGKKYFPAYIRSFMVQFLTELEIYKNPNQDLSALENRINQTYLLVEKPVKRAAPLTDMMIISYPVYQHNYLFSEIIAWQVHDVLQKKFGDRYPFNFQTGEYLKEKLYRDGEYYFWQQRLKNATGKPLDVSGYMKVKMGITD